MPYAVVVNNYLCLHGGIATTLDTVSQIADLPFPDLNPDDPTAFQLLWNDPRDMIEYSYQAYEETEHTTTEAT